jgi:molybdenum cofactor cytidylyltransferase
MISAVVLAAGASRRMGTQKLLLPYAGKTVITHIVDQLCGSHLDEIIVVTGHEPERITTELAGRPNDFAHNRDYESGMLSSVRCGLRALPRRCGAALVALGDQPAITTALVNEMVRVFEETRPGILVPSHGGRRGHPMIFSRRYFDEILAHYDDAGLRGLLQAHPEDVLELEAATDAVLLDMDYPEDYRRELARFEATKRKA